MKYTRQHMGHNTWNGNKSLPEEIHVMSPHSHMAEFELLSILCTLHGHITAFDLLTGAEPDSEKDKDISSVMNAFQSYLFPKMPLSHYSGTDKRLLPSTEKRGGAIDASKS
jgi:hypothetical protein